MISSKMLREWNKDEKNGFDYGVKPVLFDIISIEFFFQLRMETLVVYSL